MRKTFIGTVSVTTVDGRPLPLASYVARRPEPKRRLKGQGT